MRERNAGSIKLPPLVEGARKLARSEGFTRGCTPEAGRLLQVLAAGALPGTVGEIGTGCGEGAAWLHSGLRNDQRLVSVECNLRLHRPVLSLFSNQPNAHIVFGDWRALKGHAPFSLLFIDAAEAKDEGAPEAVDLLAVGGIAVLDNFTYRPDGLWQGKPDPRREFWLGQRNLVATEILLTPAASTIVAVRRF